AVTLRDSVVILSRDGATVLVGMQARCAWDGTSLYLLDQQSGLVWAVSGAESLGTAVVDRGYAATLVHSLPKNSPDNAPQALEAARFVGCNEATQLRANQGSVDQPIRDASNPTLSAVSATELSVLLSQSLKEINSQLLMYAPQGNTTPVMLTYASG